MRHTADTHSAAGAARRRLSLPLLVAEPAAPAEGVATGDEATARARQPAGKQGPSGPDALGLGLRPPRLRSGSRRAERGARAAGLTESGPGARGSCLSSACSGPGGHLEPDWHRRRPAEAAQRAEGQEREERDLGGCDTLTGQLGLVAGPAVRSEALLAARAAPRLAPRGRRPAASRRRRGAPNRREDGRATVVPLAERGASARRSRPRESGGVGVHDLHAHGHLRSAPAPPARRPPACSHGPDGRIGTSA